MNMMGKLATRRSLQEIAAEAEAKVAKHVDERGSVRVTFLGSWSDSRLETPYKGGYFRGDSAGFDRATALELVTLGTAVITAELSEDELWALERPNLRGPRPSTPEGQAYKAKRAQERATAEEESRILHEQEGAARRLGQVPQMGPTGHTPLGRQP